MSVNLYARQAPCSDAAGRADYISNPERQENLMATANTYSLPNYWQLLSADSQAAFRQAGGSRENQACEAREIHVQLPNSALQRMTADQLAQKIANDFRSQYGVDCLVAIHYNKRRSNLHCHILFSERQELPAPDIKYADRNAFIGADGIRKRTKKEILDADGQLLPGCSIVKKGEILSARYFGDKNTMFAEKSWMDEYRLYMADWINRELQPDELRTVYDPNGPYLAQQHIGKGTPAPKRRELEEWNKLVRIYNGLLDGGYVAEAEAHDFKTRVMLSPNQNQELRAVIAELQREIEPGSPHRPQLDAWAAQSATTPLSADVADRQTKQELRQLYKQQGAARIDILSKDGIDRQIAQAKAQEVNQAIEKKKAQLGLTPEQQRLRELGRLAGVKPAEVDRMYKAAPRMTREQWSQVWGGCRAAQDQFWNGYRARQQELQRELTAAYKRRRRVKNAEWAVNPRNRRASLLGILWACIVLARNGWLYRVDAEIDRLKAEQTALRREVQRFKAATTETYDTLHERGLSPEQYLATVQRMQRMADDISRGERPQELHRPAQHKGWDEISR